MFSCTSTLSDHKVTQPVSYWFAYHVSCKVEYFGEVYSERFHEEVEGKTMFFHVFRSTVVPWAQPVFSCGSLWVTNTIDEIYSVTRRQFVSKRPRQSTQQNLFLQTTFLCSFTTFSSEVNGATRRTNWITTEVIICLATRRMKQTTKLLQLTVAGKLN